MKTVIIAGFVIEPMTPTSFKIMTVDRSKDANMHYRTIASEFAKKTGFKIESTNIIPDGDHEIRFTFKCSLPESPEIQFDPDEKTPDIAGLAKWFNLEPDFVGKLAGKLTDKCDAFIACQLFADGVMSYDIATGDNTIDVNAIRDAYIANIEKNRANAKAVADYYNSCLTVQVEHTGGKYREIAFIKDGRLVAFGQFTRDHNGGIYAANNDVQKIPGWDVYACVGKFRIINKQAYKEIKRLAVNEPAETFKFDQKTIHK